jgi:aspartyl protease family protein
MGFMARSTWISALAVCVALGSASAVATDVNVIGLFPGKAVVVINRGAPRTLAVGQATPEGVKLISADRSAAVIEIDGKRHTLEMGQHFATAEPKGSGGTVTVASDNRGHYYVDGQVNGQHIRFLVDTGATLVSISAADARRMGLDYRAGQPGYTIVADGRRVPTWRLTLDSVTVGDITLYGIDAAVSEGETGMALLGMSFLSRTQMRREGQELTLTKRY